MDISPNALVIAQQALGSYRSTLSSLQEMAPPDSVIGAIGIPLLLSEIQVWKVLSNNTMPQRIINLPTYCPSSRWDFVFRNQLSREEGCGPFAGLHNFSI